MITTVHISDDVKSMPELCFELMVADNVFFYKCELQEGTVENKVTAAARRTCSKANSWRDIQHADTYIEFYKQCGLRANRVSNPLKQAYRFVRKPYRSVCPIVDSCMFAEYSTGISTQVFAPPVMNDMRIIRAQAAADIRSRFALQAQEICFCSGEILIHAPSAGLQPETMVMCDTTHVVICLMKIPGIPMHVFKNAQELLRKELDILGSRWRNLKYI